MDPTEEAIRWAYGCLAAEADGLFYSSQISAAIDCDRMDRLAEFISNPDRWEPIIFPDNGMWVIQRKPMQDPCQVQPEL